MQELILGLHVEKDKANLEGKMMNSPAVTSGVDEVH